LIDRFNDSKQHSYKQLNKFITNGLSDMQNELSEISESNRTFQSGYSADIAELINKSEEAKV